MGNELRDIRPEMTNHVYSRCADLKKLMKKEVAKEIMVEEINRTMQIYRFDFIFFEILDDHFHFVIKTLKDEANISRIMQRIKGVYARRVNKLLNRQGPFWNERFGSKIIEYEQDPRQYLFTLLWYISYNQAKKLKHAKRKLYNPRNNEYCSLNHYLVKDFRGKIKITIHQFFHDLGSTFEECVKRFLKYENRYLNLYGIVN